MLVSQNFTEQEVLDMPLDKYYLYLRACLKNANLDRALYVGDMVSVLGISFSEKPKEALSRYIDSITPPD